MYKAESINILTIDINNKAFQIIFRVFLFCRQIAVVQVDIFLLGISVNPYLREHSPTKRLCQVKALLKDTFSL